MFILRILIFALVIWLCWRMIKTWLAAPEKKESGNILSSRKMVKCAYCNTHLPQDQALGDDGKWFCHQQHKSLFEKK
jgi:uncharacterized protein